MVTEGTRKIGEIISPNRSVEVNPHFTDARW